MPNYPDGKVHIGFINVGMGDCTVIKGPQGELAIIDCGSTNFGNTNIQQISNDIQGLVGGPIQFIDFILITHSDADHYNQIGPLVNNTPIKVIYHTDTLGEFRDNVFRKWYFGSGRFKGTGKNCLNGMQELFLNDPDDEAPQVLADWSHNGVNCKIELLAANVDAEDIEIDEDIDASEMTAKAYLTNSLSAVLKITAHDQIILIAGDATKHTEKFILDNAPDELPSDIIRVGHHGSKTSSSQGFVDKVSPGKAIISSSVVNSHHLPKKSVVSRWLTKLPSVSPASPHNIVQYDDGSLNQEQISTSKNLFVTDLSNTITISLP